ncbi:YceI family protein [Streptosporangium sp. NBC_01639]|uniref:YceI family protein n=1 Tax=unclassified Streptosporangium TaxID=2632669 RepID=UPI002DD994A8|nr:YceI family protein [Streptosporangium sp. NBC_01756]WSC90463.1 YceI family protein [Streptosporangium sp. NBC_01756]WTD58634.1 YceI family protein [Streptosporangium sp. NBC_01639]
MYTSPQDFESAPSGRRGLHALVRTKDGWAVPYAIVTVTDMSGNQVVRTETDAEGAVLTEPLAPGVYTAVVTAAGYAPIASTAIATASGAAELGTLVLARQGGVELPPPGRWAIDPAHSKVSATAQHLGLSSVQGRFAEFSGRIEVGATAEASSVAVEIDATSIGTGNDTRDDHLRSADFLDVESYPTISYWSTGLSAAGPDRWTLHGVLMMSGITRPVDLDLTYLGTSPDPWGGLRAAFHAVTELRREDFAMNYNQVVQAGISLIGATLKVELDVQAVQGELAP